jgi:hypothetical protein
MKLYGQLARIRLTFLLAAVAPVITAAQTPHAKADVYEDRRTTLFRAPAATAAAPGSAAASHEQVILDTDVGGDIDDAGALAVMHALADSGEIEILAVGVVNGHELAVPYCDAVNTWYGRPEIPIGTIKSQAPFVRDRYLAPIVAAYPHRVTQSAAPDVVSLYRRILAAQPDHSVTFVVIGPPTNISHLLDSKPDEYSPLDGVELMRRKVKFYGAGGNGDGKLPHGKPGFNYQMDIRAARNELAKLSPEIPMVFAGGSGFKLEIGSCYTGTISDHIIRRSFEAYFPGTTKLDLFTWDELRMLYACRPSARTLFETSAPGDITMDDNNHLHWTSERPRNRAYAYVADWTGVRAELTRLMTHPPERRVRAD